MKAHFTFCKSAGRFRWMSWYQANSLLAGMMSVLISQGLVDESLQLPHKLEDNLSREADRRSKSGVPDSTTRGAAGFKVENVDVLFKCNKKRQIFYQCMRKRRCRTCVVSKKWWNAAKLSFQSEKCSPERINRSLIRLTRRRIFHPVLNAYLCHQGRLCGSWPCPLWWWLKAQDLLTAKTLEAMNIYSPENLFFFWWVLHGHISFYQLFFSVHSLMWL